MGLLGISPEKLSTMKMRTCFYSKVIIALNNIVRLDFAFAIPLNSFLVSKQSNKILLLIFKKILFLLVSRIDASLLYLLLLLSISATCKWTRPANVHCFAAVVQQFCQELEASILGVVCVVLPGVSVPCCLQLSIVWYHTVVHYKEE